MARRVAKEVTLEEFEAWAAAGDRFDAVARAPTRRAGRACRWCRCPTSRTPGRPTCCRPPPPRRLAAIRARATPSRHALRRRSARRQPQAPRRLERRAAAPVPVPSRRDRLGPSRQRRRAPFRARRPTGSRPLAGLRRGVGHRAPARRRAAVRDRLRPRDQRPHRAGLSRRRFGRRAPQPERPAADVAARPARPPALRAPWEQRGDADPQAEAVASFSALLDAVTDTPA